MTLDELPSGENLPVRAPQPSLHVLASQCTLGAGAVLQQLVANGGETRPPLFNSAILSSIYYPPQYNYNDPIPEKVYSEVVRIAG